MNNDLISRQAILKHIEKIRQGLQMMDNTHRTSIIMNGMHLCEEAVRNQPSAQPEQRWIPVSEKLPNFAQRVLVSISNFVYEAIYFDEDAGWSTYNISFKDVEDEDILAWMPLPVPYKEEQDADGT